MSRSVKKGPFIEKALYKKVLEVGKTQERRIIKTYSRCSTIIPEMVGKTISVYNGKTWVPVYITETSLGTSSASFLPRGFFAVIRVRIKKRGRAREYVKEKSFA